MFSFADKQTGNPCGRRYSSALSVPIMRNWLIVTIAAFASIGYAVLAVCADAANTDDNRRLPAETIFHATFDTPADIDLNGWPKAWRREYSPAYPRYVEARVDKLGPASEGRSLRIDLDGGAACALSPPVSVSPHLNYAIEAFVRTEGLANDRAFISVTFYGSFGKVLERCVSSPVERTTDWTRLRIGPIAPSNPATRQAVVGLHLEPSQHADLTGTAWFGDVSIGRMPRVALEADRASHLYLLPGQPQVTCAVSGISDTKSMITFQLFDVDDHELQRARMPLVLDETTQSDGDAVSIAHAKWQPALPNVGYYKIRCSLDGKADAALSPEISVALIDAQPAVAGGEFGWTLSHAEQGIPLEQLAGIAEQSGISWLKLPVWSAPGNSKRAEQLAVIAERLQAAGIKIVGMLADPPVEVRKQFDTADPLVAAQVFSAKPELWTAALEPTLSALSPSVHWWQLGADGDFSFVNFDGSAITLETVQKQIASFGPKPQIGCSWPLHRAIPTTPPNWSFLALSAANNALSDSSTAPSANAPKMQRWINLEPDWTVAKTARERVTGLSQQMLSAKLEQVEGIFLPNAVATQNGLVSDDGAIGEMFLPWRTTTQALSGTKYAGKLQLAQGSTNYLFSRDQELVMMLWNDAPCNEPVSLGDKIWQVNLWARSSRSPWPSKVSIAFR